MNNNTSKPNVDQDELSWFSKGAKTLKDIEVWDKKNQQLQTAEG